MSDAMPGSFLSLEPVLARVAGPGQYVGGEPNQIVRRDAAVRVALAFPDLYTVGMSHHGMRILYDIANQLDDVAAERVFAPLPDMERELRSRSARLSTLETATPLDRCAVVGFSLCYELASSSILTMLDLGGIPLTRFDRCGTAAPLVIAGGAVTLNPEPLSDFIDLFVIGEGEDAFPELLRIVRDAGPLTAANRDEILRTIACTVQGVYAPALYDTREQSDGTVVLTGPNTQGAPWPVQRRIVQDFEHALQPARPIVPIYQTVHERAVLEIMRGCPNGCRFCQAGFINRPVRWRSPELLAGVARRCIAATGYDEIGLLSLSSSNYPEFDRLVQMLDAEFTPQGVSLSLPSLRVDQTLHGIPSRLAGVRKSGLTVAPEAGTERLRAVINKDVKDEDLLSAAEEAFRCGWRQIKLYFMVGLPTETDEDAAAIAELANTAARRCPPQGGRRLDIRLSASNFIPKPHTPFQWCGAAHPDVWAARQQIIARAVNRRRVSFHGHDTRVSLLEAALSRGDRRLGKVMLEAWRRGARLDAWTEHFRPDVWEDAFAACGMSAADLATREYDLDAPLPWAHIDTGFAPGYLRREYDKAFCQTPTRACGPGSCSGCAVAGCQYITMQTKGVSNA